MVAGSITENDIYELYKLCNQMYAKHNISIKFPSHTDPTKTYQWRYLKSLHSKFGQWGFDDDMKANFIKFAIAYAKRNGYLHKGLAIFHQSNIIDLCYEEAKKSHSAFESNAVMILKQHRWLVKQAGSDTIENVLLNRQGFYKNIVLWHQSSNISGLYISVSKACLQAYKKLTKAETEMVPSLETLYFLRQSFTANPDSKRIISVINHKDS